MYIHEGMYLAGFVTALVELPKKFDCANEQYMAEQLYARLLSWGL